MQQTAPFISLKIKMPIWLFLTSNKLEPRECLGLIYKLHLSLNFLTLQALGREAVFCRCRSLFPFSERRYHREAFLLRLLSRMSWLLWSALQFMVACMVESFSEQPHDPQQQLLWDGATLPCCTAKSRTRQSGNPHHVMLWWTCIYRALSTYFPVHLL